MIEVKNLTKKFGSKTVISNLSFQIEEGEILGLVGQSGCGKSTLAKILMRLESPSSGQIFFQNREITFANDPNLSKKIQMIFQNPYASLNPKMTIEEILKEPLKIHHLHEEIDEMLQSVGLSATFKHRYPHELSGGQRQRISIARALLLKPQFLICDEPISALDVSIQAQIANLLLFLQKKHRLTYLFIAHDLSMVRYLATKIAVMYEGTFVEFGPADAIMENPLHPYTQQLINVIPSFSTNKKNNFSMPNSPQTQTPGCPFYHQCPKSALICKMNKPILKEINKNHFLSCHCIEKN